MSERDSVQLVSRRKALAVGISVAGGFAGAALAGCASPGVGMGGALPQTSGSSSGGGTAMSAVQGAGVPRVFLSRNTIQQIQQIIQAEGMTSNGVFSIEIDRDDIPNVTLRGVPILPANQINGTLNFQCLGGDRVAMNSDMALKANEIDRFIDQLISHDIIFQAEHQHFYDFSPLVWFIHFRATGDALQIARGIKAALNVTSTPFPQTSPKNPKTPLPAEELGDIIGAAPSIGANGIVNFDVPRDDPISLGGMRINPYLNVATTIAFQPYGGGQNAVAVPDFGMISSEIQRVVALMRSHDWDIGCLYNQETDEQPQLFFSHQFKTGNALTLAREIRQGLNRMDMAFKTP